MALLYALLVFFFLGDGIFPYERREGWWGREWTRFTASPPALEEGRGEVWHSPTCYSLLFSLMWFKDRFCMIRMFLHEMFSESHTPQGRLPPILFCGGGGGEGGPDWTGLDRRRLEEVLVGLFLCCSKRRMNNTSCRLFFFLRLPTKLKNGSRPVFFHWGRSAVNDEWWFS